MSVNVTRNHMVGQSTVDDYYSDSTEINSQNNYNITAQYEQMNQYYNAVINGQIPAPPPVVWENFLAQMNSLYEQLYGPQWGGSDWDPVEGEEMMEEFPSSKLQKKEGQGVSKQGSQKTERVQEEKASAENLDEKTQQFLAAFSDPPVTFQDLEKAGLAGEIKYFSGTPSQALIQFVVSHDNQLQNLVAQGDLDLIRERLSSLMGIALGVEAYTPEEEEAKKYGLDKADSLFVIGKKAYQVRMVGAQMNLDHVEGLSEKEMKAQEIAEKLTELSGMEDVKATEVLAKAKERGINLTQLPASPNQEAWQFLVEVDPKLGRMVEDFLTRWKTVGKPPDPDWRALRDRLSELLQVLYPDAGVSPRAGGGKKGDDLNFRGRAYDAINQDRWEEAYNSKQYGKLFQLGGGEK